MTSPACPPCARPLSGQTVLVTGAPSPIGAAICRAVAHAGARVVIHYHSPTSRPAAEALAAELHAPPPFACDLADTAAIAQDFPLLPLDALVNNAALFLPDTAPAADLYRMDVLNYAAPTVLLELLAEQGTPFSVINLLDARVVPPFSGPPPRSPFSAYLQTKRVLAASTIRDARRYAPRGIRVNGVAPGPVSLPAGTHVPAGPLPLAGAPHPTPADIAAAVLFLLASPQITGQILYVDSGQHLALAP